MKIRKETVSKGSFFFCKHTLLLTYQYSYGPKSYS